MNTTLTIALDRAFAAQSKGEGSFGSLVEFAHEYTSALTTVGEALRLALKGAIEGEEQAYEKAHAGKSVKTLAAWRSAKSVVLAAVEAGIALVDEKGKPIGKTALEKAIKETRSPKSNVEKFAIAMNTASAVFAKVDTLADVMQCKALLAVLADQVVKAEAAAKAAC